MPEREGAGGGREETEGAALRAALSLPGTCGAAVRLACREGGFAGHTSGLAPGCAQANLVLLPRESAFDFLLWVTRNPKPAPLLEVTRAGQPVLPQWEREEGGQEEAPRPVAPGARSVAPGADLRCDLPQYCVWKDGVCVDTPTSIHHLWDTPDAPPSSHPDARSDWVAFLLGCSFSFEEALLRAGLPVRHLQEAKAGGTAPSGQDASPPSPLGAPGGEPLVPNPRNVPMYLTNVPTAAAGPFSGPLVVSMRPMTPAQAVLAGDVTGRFPRVHGTWMHAGAPGDIGIADVGSPDYGDAVTIREGEVPVFWACGVTPQAVLRAARLPIAITHAPGHMLVLDVTNEALAGEARVR